MKARAAARKTPATPRKRATDATVMAKLAPDDPAVVAAIEHAAPLEFLPTRPSTAPRTGPRHAVFIDVENTSSEIDLAHVLEGLQIDRATTELTAVGNWRVVGQQLGRMLAQRGAHLVHSAPAPRVPDWSDLWIAVTAGMWLGRAMPGDSLHILSDDRAFDAVGDAAARLGVTFRRITYRTLGGAGDRTSAHGEDAPASGRRRRRRRRGESASHAQTPRPHEHGRAHAPAAPTPSAAALPADEERHGASLDHIRAAIARLTAPDPVRGVSLDSLTLALKAEGFQRPPGSPRLVTRLRRIKDVELLPNGRVRLIGASAEMISAAVEGTFEPSSAAAAEPAQNGTAPERSDAAPGAETPEIAATTGAKRRSRRRGGRGRRGGRRRGAKAATPEGNA